MNLKLQAPEHEASESPEVERMACALGLDVVGDGQSLRLELLLGLDRGRRVDQSVSILSRQLLQGLALGLGDEQSGEDTAKHEQSEDLHNVVEPGGGGRVLGSLVH